LPHLLVLMALLPLAGHGQTGRNNAGPTASETPFSNVRRNSLLNGLQIVTYDRPGEPTIKCEIIIRVGSMFDSVGKSGLVALTQRTLLAVNPQLRGEIESLQSKIEWGVDTDKTWFRLESPPATFEAALEILSRLLVVETIRLDAFKRAQEEQLIRIKEQLSPAARADEAFYVAVYGDYPYGRNVIGNELMVSNLRQGDVYDIFQRFYLANNASVILSGNVAPERTLRAFKYFFGAWSKGAATPPTFRQPVQVPTPRFVRIDDQRSAEVEVRAGLQGVKYTSPEFQAVQLLAEVLLQRWRVGAPPPTAALPIMAEPRVLAGPILFSARVVPTEVEAVTKRLSEGFSSLAAIPPSEQELASARSALISRLDSRTVEEWLSEIEAFALPRNFPLQIRPRIGNATPSDLQILAKRLTDANALTVVVLGRLGEAAK
ncbi:MAG: insulinase family protein, partial [Acidobacteria bacterium]|nr:insulinase family protein [Acidobacteriota bacterium]